MTIHLHSEAEAESSLCWSDTKKVFFSAVVFYGPLTAPAVQIKNWYRASRAACTVMFCGSWPYSETLHHNSKLTAEVCVGH